MSDVSPAALTPLYHPVQAGKKRRRNFRPTGRNKSQKTTISLKLNGNGSTPTQDDDHENQQSNAKTSLVFGEPLEAGPVEDTTMTAPDKRVNNPASFSSTQQSKKKKKMGIQIGASRSTGRSVAVGISRLDMSLGTEIEPVFTDDDPTTISPLTETPEMASGKNDTICSPQADITAEMMDEAILSQDPGDAPRLSFFCTSFKVERRDDKNDAAQTREDRKSQIEDDEQPASTAAAGPIVQIVNGEIVLQESSVLINGVSTRADDEYLVVEEEAQLATVGASYDSFVQRIKPQQWTVEETQKFYEALRQVGIDFNTMEIFFDNKRTRKQLKRKYKMELEQNPHLIEKALDPIARREIDLSVFQLTEEEKKQLDEPRVPEPPKQQSTDSKGEQRENPSKNEEEVVEEDAAIEEDAAVEVSASEFAEAEWPVEVEQQRTQVDEDPMFAEEEEDHGAMISLLPGATTNSKSKKKPKFRSIRKKKKK